jgi:GntR family transcriptional regulator
MTKMSARLRREAPDPLYVQLRNTLTADIRAGRYGRHQRLPSERELSERFKVSRMTARQALLDLARHGFAYTRIGRGTFVAEPKVQQQLFTLTGFTQDVRARGAQPGSSVLEFGVSAAAPDVASSLRIAAGAEIIKLARVRLSDSLPLSIEIAHLPLSLCPQLLGHDFATESLYAILERDCGIVFARAEQTIEARLAEARELELLELVAPAVVLRIERTTFSTGGVPVEYVESVVRADRFRFHSILQSRRPPS